MDNFYRRGREHDQPVANTRQAFAPNAPPQQSRAVYNTVDRSRSGLLNTSPSTPRSMGDVDASYNYMQEPSSSFVTGNMSASSLSYGASEYGQDTRQQAHSFGSGYNPANLMYNVPPQGNHQSVYDAQQPYGQARPTALQLMTPDVNSSYFSSENGGHQHTNSMPQQAAATSKSFQQQHQSPMAAGFSNQMTSSMHTVAPGQGASVDMMAAEHDYNEGELEEKWHTYQRQLGSVFQDISVGSLEGASVTLLNISNWLLSQVVDLGLTQDDASLHGDRVKLWGDFNHAWLALGYRQRELAAEDPSRRHHSLLSEDTIKKLGNELVRLCDGIERHGLVDYQYGVWEDQIESVLSDCLEQFAENNDEA